MNSTGITVMFITVASLRLSNPTSVQIPPDQSRGAHMLRMSETELFVHDLRCSDARIETPNRSKGCIYVAVCNGLTIKGLQFMGNSQSRTTGTFRNRDRIGLPSPIPVSPRSRWGVPKFRLPKRWRNIVPQMSGSKQIVGNQCLEWKLDLPTSH